MGSVKHHGCVICWSIRAMWIGLALMAQIVVFAVASRWGSELRDYTTWSVAAFLIGGALIVGGMLLSGGRARNARHSRP